VIDTLTPDFFSRLVSCAGKAKTNHSVHFYCHFLQTKKHVFILRQEIGGTEKFVLCFGFKKSKPNINFSVPPQEMLPPSLNT